MERAKTPLDLKPVSEIKGTFFVPSYQRGYRWGRDEVELLLNDIYGLMDAEKEQEYCLQPIVVINDGEKYELIDGQQRLTTIYLIYMYLYKSFQGFFTKPDFSLIYQNRNGSKAFLEEIDLTRATEYIDFWFMCEAYKTIDRWFSARDKQMAAIKILEFFKSKVKVIWYEIDSGLGMDGNALFTRLNIGKIPLTSAELVKAMFLCKESESELEVQKQQEIALQWDNIEKELHDDSLWSFLTNHDSADYQTRIDLVLDLISNKADNEKEKYATFFYFDQQRKNAKDKKEWRTEIWRKIEHTFLVLKDWYEDHDYYHKIGFLIASEEVTLRTIYEDSINKTKSDFQKSLNERIKNVIHIGKNYGELSYEHDYEAIYRLLLLFNIESVRKIDHKAQRFPFDQFKKTEDGKVVWSLEHIHAQQSEGLNDRKQQKEWIANHIKALNTIGGNPLLVDRMEAFLQDDAARKEDFIKLQQETMDLLSERGGVDYKHTIANLALLNNRDNAALNNSVFAVKRDLIIEMDRAGQFIPFCTKMVFLKYYSSSEGNQLHFWGQKDREAYVAKIYETLKEYMSEPILLVREERQ
ncbi:MAG: DUF262 domain-containing protein [Lachnospiraceae bacterium]|nr:DUF262 domain-containing protein [Lachnospiraceae bacterium]